MSEGTEPDHLTDVSTDTARRLSFGSVAEHYDRYRPGYPAELVDAVLEYAGAEPGDRILDVGAGTGRAALLFAARGYEITAIEPDSEMAAVASKRAATAGLSIEVVASEFERARLEQGAYAALVSGTAWHWVAPAKRAQLAAGVLRPGGALAPFWNRPRWRDNPVRPAFDAAYLLVEADFAARAAGPMNPRGAPLEIEDDREWLEEELRGNSDFVDLEARVYEWKQRYTSDEYVGLLGTHSDHIMLPGAARERLLAAVRKAIDDAGGSFELNYQTLLCLARCRAT